MESLYKHLPNSPGIYLMKDAKGKILYIGKAASLRRRVSSYFHKAHEYRIEKLLSQIKKISYKKTDTAIEALILESRLIKKHKPPYNVREKDDKSFLCVEFTREKFPRVLLVRSKSKPQGERFGPFTSASSIRQTLRILRRIFPYSIHPPYSENRGRIERHTRPCFDYEIGLCPGTCIGKASREEYSKNIRNLKLFFQGKKKQIVKNLEKEMRRASAHLEFEKAAEMRRRLFALQHIQDTALIEDEKIQIPSVKFQTSRRIEGYDVSNISGTYAVGSMAVFTDGKPDKKEYRKFKIYTVRQSDDVGMLKEVLRRRLRHTEWRLPDMILIDGGKGQVNAAKEVLEEYYGLRIPVVGIAKGPRRKRTDIVGIIPKEIDKKTLIHLRDEAHRFATAYHKKVRAKRFLEKG